jgi:hypothetical protein
MGPHLVSGRLLPFAMTRGSCLCGKVQFRVSEFSSEIYKCHCSICRKNFGGASSAATFATESNFEWLKGENKTTRYKHSPGYYKQFCTTCGSVVPGHMKSHGLYWIPAGLLDDDPGIPLGRHLYVESKAQWEVLDSVTEQIPEGFDF